MQAIQVLNFMGGQAVHKEEDVVAESNEGNWFQVRHWYFFSVAESISYSSFPSTGRLTNRRCCYEQSRVIKQWHFYLQRMRRKRMERRPVVFLDETWANAHDGKDCAWVERDVITGCILGGVR